MPNSTERCAIVQKGSGILVVQAPFGIMPADLEAEHGGRFQGFFESPELACAELAQLEESAAWI